MHWLSHPHRYSCRLQTKTQAPDSCFRLTVLWFCCSWMYWTDWEEDEVNDSIGRIEKAWMDGSNRNIFVTSNMLWPNGLTLDHGTSTMYWCDAYYDHIERIYLNGTGRMVRLLWLIHIYFIRSMADEVVQDTFHCSFTIAIHHNCFYCMRSPLRFFSP